MFIRVMRLCFVSFLLALNGCGIIGAGSYPNAERYYFNCTDRELVKVVDIFLKKNDKYNVGEELKSQEKVDDLHGVNSIKIHYKYIALGKSNAIASFLIRKRGINNPYESSIIFFAVDKDASDGIQRWTAINSNYNLFNNLNIKKEFKQKFINEINKMLSKENL